MHRVSLFYHTPSGKVCCVMHCVSLFYRASWLDQPAVLISLPPVVFQPLPYPLIGCHRLVPILCYQSHLARKVLSPPHLASFGLRILLYVRPRMLCPSSPFSPRRHCSADFVFYGVACVSSPLPSHTHTRPYVC